MPMPKYLRNLDGTAGKPQLSEGTMLSEGPVNDCIGLRLRTRNPLRTSPALRLLLATNVSALAYRLAARTPSLGSLEDS